MQELLKSNNKVYDRITYKTEDGDEEQIYFDITDGFGKLES